MIAISKMSAKSVCPNYFPEIPDIQTLKANEAEIGRFFERGNALGVFPSGAKIISEVRN